MTDVDSAHSAKSEVQAFVAPKPSPSDFWEMAKNHETILQEYASQLLRSAAIHFESTKFTDVTVIMNRIVSITTTFRDSIKGALDARHIAFDTFTKDLGDIFTAVAANKLGISLPNKTPGHAERARIVDKILDDAVLALIILATRCGIKKEVVTSFLFALKPLVQALIVTVGMSTSSSIPRAV